MGSKQIDTQITVSNQLPYVCKNSNILSSPLIEKMKSLHLANINTIKKQKEVERKTVENFQLNKKHYFQTIYVKKSHKIQFAVDKVINKSKNLMKMNQQKHKKHFDQYSMCLNLNRQKIEKIHLKQNQKIQQAEKRRKRYRLKTGRNQSPKDINHLINISDLNKSQLLHVESVKKLKQAQKRRNLIKQNKNKQNIAKLEISIINAQNYIKYAQNERSQKVLEYSVEKIKKTQRLFCEKLQRIRSSSQISRKSNSQKLNKAKNNKNKIQQELIEKLQKMVQQKQKRTESINIKKNKNLQELSQNIKRIANNRMNQTQKNNQSLMTQLQRRKQNILQDSRQKRFFMTAIKLEKNIIKNKNLYETQQFSFRY